MWVNENVASHLLGGLPVVLGLILPFVDQRLKLLRLIVEACLQSLQLVDQLRTHLEGLEVECLIPARTNMSHVDENVYLRGWTS